MFNKETYKEKKRLDKQNRNLIREFMAERDINEARNKLSQIKSNANRLAVLNGISK